MKRGIILLIMLVAAIAAGNAQFFVEGSVGVSYWERTSQNFFANKTLNISPLAGYRLNENTALGLSASLIRNTYSNVTVDSDTGDDFVVERKEHGWDFAVFDRYKIWGTKKFSILVESSVYIYKGTLEGNREWTTMQMLNLTQTSIGVKAMPLIVYDLSDRFSIIASCNFLSLNLNYIAQDSKKTGLKVRFWGFESAVTSSIYSNLPDIGIIYYFKKSGK